MIGIFYRLKQFLYKVIVVLFPLIMLSTQLLVAQTNTKKDSIKKALQEKRQLDSLTRAIKKQELKKQNDSIVSARKQQRLKDSIANVEKRKLIKDSIDLVNFKKKFGEEKLQEKLDERDRIKKMEERYKKQREEDSLFLVQNQRSKYIADSIEQVKLQAQRQRFVQDSIREVNLRITAEQKRQDSLAASEAYAKEVNRQRELDVSRKRDSLKSVVELNTPQTKPPISEVDSLATVAKTSSKEISKTDSSQEITASRPEQKPDSNTMNATPAPIPEQPKQETPDFVLMPWEEAEPKSQNLQGYKMEVIDSLRKIDSIKYYFSSFRYRLRKSTEISFYIGVSNYLGDLGGNSGLGKKFFYDNNFKKRNNFYGASITYSRSEYLGFRLSYINGKISASDHDIAYSSQKDEAYFRYKRNLDFQTKISEWSLLLELLPLKLFPIQKRAFRYPVQPYLLAGIGTFRFNPQGSYYDEIAEDYVFIDLQPLHTEGQNMKEYPDRKPYALRQWNMPFGCGVKYVFGRRTSLGFEFVGRKLFTDYLDDVSTTYIDASLFDNYFDEENAAVAKQIFNKSDEIDPDNAYGEKDIRGNPKHNDFYYSFNLKFSYRLSKLK